jgi:hypothetical protein
MARTEDKSRETKLRRMAERQGLMLQKCPRRDPLAVGYGTYRLVNPDGRRHGGVIVLGHPEWYGLDLDQVEDALNSGEYAVKVKL